MRIALVTNQLAPGGAEIQVAMLAREFRAAGHSVSVISLLPPTALASELERDGVAVCSLDLRSRPLGLARLIAFCRQQRPEVAHAHLFHANVATRLLRLICPFPVVVSTIHSIAESGRESRDTGKRDLAYRATDWLSDATVCVSQAVADRHVQARAVSAGRLRVIPNGVDTQQFRPDPDLRRRMREQLGLGDAFTWLAAGRLMWKKNYPLMLRAMAQGGSGVLLIAGAGPDEEALRESARQLGVGARFLGQRDDLPALMQAADAFLLTSDVEGLPMALLEAAASGLPVVATAAGGVAEIVAEGVTGFLTPPGELPMLAEAIARMEAAGIDTRARMGTAARGLACERFDIHTVARRWLDLYQELLERSRGRD
jgi:glycosyltransferase involved in cell wall biosynthesis